ncbi:uncharacterized protein LOC117228678 [Megalopta genalis]|uniref:uncharacterized protein LOC117228678 n=1 Tax=Megalopta genalis TaxID=115081 RepID=UPI003FD33449
MVVFTCNHCGESLPKARVAKHYEFKCRNTPFLSCVDCFKDFRGQEYASHTKCVSEAQRYGGKDYVPKPGFNKGERKQQEWIEALGGILTDTRNLSDEEQTLLKTLSKYENIPRKKSKFINFIKNAVNYRVSSNVIDNIWDKFDTVHKNNMQSTPQNHEENGKINDEVDEKNHVSEHQENNIIDNQNNENISKENQNKEEQNRNNDNVTNVDKKKKSKKRKANEAVEEQTVEPASNKKGKTIPANDQIEVSVPKKKRKSIVLSESSNNQNNEVQTIEKSTFDWKGTILDIVQSKGEISLKKLQKKVITQYMNFCSNDVINGKASIRFNKKLKKVSGVLISDGKVKLA